MMKAIILFFLIISSSHVWAQNADLDGTSQIVEETRKEGETMTSEGMALGYEKDYIREETQRLKSKSQKLERDAKTLATQNTRLDKSMESSRRRLLELDMKVRSQSAEFARLKGENTVKRERADHARNQVKSKNSELQDLSRKRETLRRELQMLEKDLRQLRAQHVKITQAMGRERAKVSNLELRKREMQRKTNSKI